MQRARASCLRGRPVSWSWRCLSDRAARRPHISLLASLFYPASLPRRALRLTMPAAS
jgi:hypothetical protein